MRKRQEALLALSSGLAFLCLVTRFSDEYALALSVHGLSATEAREHLEVDGLRNGRLLVADVRAASAEGSGEAGSGDIASGSGGPPPGAVMCPGQPSGDYCDCSGDCYKPETISFCSCAAAQACCEAPAAAPEAAAAGSGEADSGSGDAGSGSGSELDAPPPDPPPMPPPPLPPPPLPPPPN